RCGGDLETYTLDGNEAYVCAECGFVDTPVEHEATPRPEPEPWEEALKRFHEKYVEGDVAITGTGETAALVELESAESDDEAADDTDDDNPDSEGTTESKTDEQEKPA
ncbi:MAG: hypothetical protein V5A34_12925, partial [Halapricum sp.]